MIQKRLLSNLLNSSCKNSIKTAIKLCEGQIKDFDDDNMLEKITNYDKKVLLYYYSLIENTDFKQKRIERHNDEYKNDYYFYNVMKSPESKYNDIKAIKTLKGRKTPTLKQILEHSKSEDLITKDFLDTELALEDELFQKLGTWSNTLTHECEQEIKTIAGNMNFDIKDMGSRRKNDRELEKTRNNFNIKIYEALKLYKNNSEYACDAKDVFKNKDDFNDNLSIEPNPNVQKMLSLIKKFYPNQNVDKDFLWRFAYSLHIEDTAVDFYEMKNIATKQLMLYQDRAKKENRSQGEDLYEDQALITFLVPDEVKTKDGKDTCRIVNINKKEYDKYINYNNNYTLSKSYIEMYSRKYNIKDEYETEKLLINSQKGNRLSIKEVKALMAKCAISSYHVPVDYVEDFIKERGITEINRQFPPLVEQLAYCGSSLYDITPSKEKEEYLSNTLKPQEEICQKNKEKYEGKYVDPEQKFNKDFNTKDNFEKQLERRK